LVEFLCPLERATGPNYRVEMDTSLGVLCCNTVAGDLLVFWL